MVKPLVPKFRSDLSGCLMHAAEKRIHAKLEPIGKVWLHGRFFKAIPDDSGKRSTTSDTAGDLQTKVRQTDLIGSKNNGVLKLFTYEGAQSSVHASNLVIIMNKWPGIAHLSSSYLIG